MEQSDNNAVQLWIAALTGALVMLVGAVAFFMRGWFQGLRHDMDIDRDEARQDRQAHRSEHKEMWEALGNIRSVAEAADQKINTHIHTKENNRASS
jgi:hypothetical protein